MEQELLTRLFAGGETSGKAWKDFLAAYSNLFLKIIWEMEKDRDAVMDTYLRVCSKFAEGNFAILRKFKRKHGKNPPKFTTWLGAVVRNISIDAYRSIQGRQRIPRALSGLSDPDRQIFELYYWRGHSLEEIEQMLRVSRNGSPESVADVLVRLEGELLRPPASPFSEPMKIRVPYDENASPATDVRPALADQETLDRWLSRLTTDERLAIQLKFWDDLSPKEIGGVLRIASEGQVKDLLKGALKNLRSIAEKERIA